MQGHARMLQPSSSGVMHAYVKGRARDGTGTAVPARARLHAQNARTGMHCTGCACRCLHELLALRRSAASTRPALVVDCGIFRKLPCLQTRYIVERAADASMGARIDPAQPLASVRGVCRKPASYFMNFDLLRILLSGPEGPEPALGRLSMNTTTGILGQMRLLWAFGRA